MKTALLAMVILGTILAATGYAILYVDNVALMETNQAASEVMLR